MITKAVTTKAVSTKNSTNTLNNENVVTQSRVSPPSLDKLINKGQPYFGVFSQVKHINYLDYASYRINQKPNAQWQKQLKANQFAFIQMIHAPYRICVAIASIKLASSAFAYIYNEETKQLDVVEGLQPLTHNVELMGDHYQGKMAFNSKTVNVEIVFEPTTVKLRLQNKSSTEGFLLNASLKRSQHPLAVCSPTGRRGWTFTQKEPLQLIDGELSIYKDNKVVGNSDDKDNQALRLAFGKSTLANLDWTVGYMRSITNWFWACINTTLPDGRQFALNLSMGVNETGVSENACWLEDTLFYLPPVLFDRDPRNVSINNHQDDSSWSIANQDLGWSTVKIALLFTPIRVYKKDDNYGMVASIFEQWIGYYSGTLQLGSETIVLDKVIGLAEDHFAKW